MYTYTWKKYLPVIRILLKRSATGDQTLSLNRTDFEKTTKLRKPSCSFSVEIVRTRFNTIVQSAPAKDLLGILQEDEVVRNLLRQNQYAISLDSNFLLTIKDITPAETEKAEEEKD